MNNKFLQVNEKEFPYISAPVEAHGIYFAQEEDNPEVSSFESNDYYYARPEGSPTKDPSLSGTINSFIGRSTDFLKDKATDWDFLEKEEEVFDPMAGGYSPVHRNRFYDADTMSGKARAGSIKYQSPVYTKMDELVDPNAVAGHSKFGRMVPEEGNIFGDGFFKGLERSFANWSQRQNNKQAPRAYARGVPNPASAATNAFQVLMGGATGGGRRGF